MKTYKGVLLIDCKLKKGKCPRKVEKNVVPDCLDCPDSETRIVNLANKTLVKFTPPRPAKKAKTKTSKK